MQLVLGSPFPIFKLKVYISRGQKCKLVVFAKLSLPTETTRGTNSPTQSIDVSFTVLSRKSLRETMNMCYYTYPQLGIFVYGVLVIKFLLGV